MMLPMPLLSPLLRRIIKSSCDDRQIIARHQEEGSFYPPSTARLFADKPEAAKKARHAAGLVDHCLTFLHSIRNSAEVTLRAKDCRANPYLKNIDRAITSVVKSRE